MFDYYCVSCGNHLHGGDICFDLNELLKMRNSRKEGAPKNMLTMVTWKQLRQHTDTDRASIQHGQVAKFTLRLNEYLGIIGENNERLHPDGIGAREMELIRYSELDTVLRALVDTNENEGAAERQVRDISRKISNCFRYCGIESTDEREETANYEAEMYIKPIFFDNGRSPALYTLEYKEHSGQANTVPISIQKRIRGYCPICGKPVPDGFGAYEQIRVGLVGAQSSGKTTLILSMLAELQKLETVRKLKIRFPGGVLCDERYSELVKNQELFQKGWSPLKTAAEGGNAFNASVLLESAVTHRKVILTFVDIAGEKCYDRETGTFSMDALARFPLINSCSMYLLCTCLDERQYGNADAGGTGDLLPHDAVLQIARGIYDSLKTRRDPPLCVVLTKADTAQNAVHGAPEGNPFRRIRVMKAYRFRSQLDNLMTTYDAISEDAVRGPLAWCTVVYGEMKNRTYMSMMLCSALGREGEMSPDTDSVEMNARGAFTPRHVDDLLQWILTAAGISPADGAGRFFPAVPSYHEIYHISGRESGGTDNSYTENTVFERSELVPQVFMNPSPDDVGIYNAGRKGPTFFNRNPVRKYLEAHRLLV